MRTRLVAGNGVMAKRACSEAQAGSPFGLEFAVYSAGRKFHPPQAKFPAAYVPLAGTRAPHGFAR